MSAQSSKERWVDLIDELQAIRGDMVRLVDESADLLRDVNPEHRASARNLLHYMALRSRDLRGLQARLAAAGLSSLGRAESHVLSAIDAVLHVVGCLRGGIGTGPGAEPALTLAEGERLLDAHTESALGPRPGRGVAIMVTMPTEAADDYALVSDLVRHGMDCMRINCAHDSSDEWARMIDHVRRASEQHGRACRVLMDLAGPKIRTGTIEPGPTVTKIKPRRDLSGRVAEAARVWLFAEERPRSSPMPADASLPVPAAWLARLATGDHVRLQDARGARRTLKVLNADTDGCWVESSKTCYVESGTPIRLQPGTVEDEAATGLDANVGALPPAEMRLQLQTGDQLTLTREPTPGRNAVRDEHGHVLTPASISCTAERLFDDVRTGDRIWFDDGRIGGAVERRESDRLHVRITRTRVGGAKLGSEKGINVPDTRLRLPAITDKDRTDLAFVAQHADLVALSFVNSAEDVCGLRQLLEPFGDAQPAIVLKIETRRGFENLPGMLLEAMKAPRCAVMIARGDLAVECGFERLAEVQEEILWLCEAAHVPVIWATQVLETLAKEGLPSRAEVTDAAMAHRAECVMLNKGPYVVQAVQALDDILRRMRGHQNKKRAMLRELGLVSTFRRGRARRRAAEPALQPR